MAFQAVLQHDHQEVLNRLLNTKLQQAFEAPPLAPGDGEEDDEPLGPQDLADSLGALDLAAKGIAALGANLKQVNDIAEQRAAWFDAEAARLKAEIEDQRQDAAEWKVRSDDFEEKLAAAIRRAEKAEARAGQAESALELLKSRILSLLGVESDAGRIVAELRKDEAQV